MYVIKTTKTMNDLPYLKQFATDKLIKLSEQEDSVDAHIVADEVLLMMLDKLGYQDIVQAYRLIDRKFK